MQLDTVQIILAWMVVNGFSLKIKQLTLMRIIIILGISSIKLKY